jgi:hypothetical protein
MDKGESSLLRVVDHVDLGRHGKPSFVPVVTSWGSPTAGPTASS